MTKQSTRQDEGHHEACHADRLCLLVFDGFHRSHEREYGELVCHAEFECHSCGRVARSERNICDPMLLEPDTAVLTP